MRCTLLKIAPIDPSPLACCLCGHILNGANRWCPDICITLCSCDALAGTFHDNLFAMDISYHWRCCRRPMLIMPCSLFLRAGHELPVSSDRSLLRRQVALLNCLGNQLLGNRPRLAQDRLLVAFSRDNTAARGAPQLGRRRTLPRCRGDSLRLYDTFAPDPASLEVVPLPPDQK
jgi:hypothetical protein